MSSTVDERRMVERLGRAQRVKLSLHSDREHWRESGDDAFYFGRMRGEIAELQEAIEQGADPFHVWNEAADVANFAAMLADRYESRVARLNASESPPPVHASPPDGSGLMPCCARTPFERMGDRMTLDWSQVTCFGDASESPPTVDEVVYEEGGEQVVIRRLADTSEPPPPEYGWHNDGDECIGPHCINMEHDDGGQR